MSEGTKQRVLNQELASAEKATRRMQEIYLEPIKPDLIEQRVSEMKSAGIVVADSPAGLGEAVLKAIG